MINFEIKTIPKIMCVIFYKNSAYNLEHIIFIFENKLNAIHFEAHYDCNKTWLL